MLTKRYSRAGKMTELRMLLSPILSALKIRFSTYENQYLQLVGQPVLRFSVNAK